MSARERKTLSDEQRLQLASIYIVLASICANNFIVGIGGGILCFIFNLALLDLEENQYGPQDQEDDDDLWGSTRSF